jgi:hypothetical protein
VAIIRRTPRGSHANLAVHITHYSQPIRNMCVMFPSFRCGVLQTRDGNQISTSPVFQTSRHVHVQEAKHCGFACDVSVLVGAVLLQCSRVAGPDGG